MNKKYNIEIVRVGFEKEGCTLISTEYVGYREKLKYICSFGHEGQISWCDWKRGRRCRECSYLARADLRRHIIKDYQTITVGRKIKWIGKKVPKNNKTKTLWECEICGNKWLAHFNHIQRLVGCPKCKSILLSKIHKGKKLSKEVKQKMSISAKNKPPMSQETKKKISIAISGEKHYNWKGGIAGEPYCSIWRYKNFKQNILNRDCGICWNIGYWHKGKPSIHHIDYDKKNCAFNNLILVTAGQNSAANKDRAFHTEWFQIAISKRLGYNYE